MSHHIGGATRASSDERRSGRVPRLRRCAAPPRRALPDVTILVRQRWHTARVRGGRAHLALALEPGRLGGREAALRLVQLAPCAHQRGFCAEQSGAASRSVVRSRRREGNLRCVCGDGPRAMRPTRKADRKSSSVREAADRARWRGETELDSTPYRESRWHRAACRAPRKCERAPRAGARSAARGHGRAAPHSPPPSPPMQRWRWQGGNGGDGISGSRCRDCVERFHDVSEK